MSVYLRPGETAPLVCADRVARLTWPYGTTEAARVILTRPPTQNPDPDATPEIFVWTTGKPAHLAHRGPWLPADSDIARDGGGTWSIATPGGVFVARPGAGCASCGTALTFEPWHPIQRVSFPRDLPRSSP